MDAGSFEQRLQMMSLQLVPFFMAIVFHEFGHGWMAKKWGDNTAYDSGRLTLNPVPHIDPIGTLLIPIMNMVTGIPLLFGWAKPVPINPSRFRKYRPGLFWVALAGPGANVLLAAISALVFAALYKFAPKDFFLSEPLTNMAMIGVQINFALAIFNLLPLPPLDGGRIIESQLSYNAAQKFSMLQQYSFFILLALLWTGALRIFSAPIMYMTNLFVTGAAYVFGIA